MGEKKNALFCADVTTKKKAVWELNQHIFESVIIASFPVELNKKKVE